MFRKTTILSLAALCGLAGTAFGQQDKQLLDAARDAQKKYDQSVITLKATVELSMQGELAAMMPNGGKQENKGECMATIIDPSGLAICSLAQLDPSSVVSSVNVRGKIMTVTGTVTDLKYRLADGTEVPARLLLKDESTDLAFVAPETALDADTLKKFESVPLDSIAEEANPLDEVIVLGRTGKGLNYEGTLSLSRVTTKLTKPRVEYIVPGGSIGVPGFNRQGKLLGFTLMHHSGSGEVNGETGQAKGEAIPVVLPASEVVSLLPQAKEEFAKPVKKAPKKEEATTKPTEPAKTEEGGK